MAEKALCPSCSKEYALTAAGMLRKHRPCGAQKPRSAAGDSATLEEKETFSGSDPWEDEHPPSHTHLYVWGDDDNGHSGSVCTVCGQEEPVISDPAHVVHQPNPWRKPLPMGTRLGGEHATPPQPKDDAPVVDAFESVERRDDPKRDRWGRYILPRPADGKEQPWQRVTTFTRITADEFALGKWQQRMAIKGLALREDLAALTATLDVKKDATKLDGIVEQAKNAAGGTKSANLGTALHSFAEIIDGGGSIEEIPTAHRADIIAYRDSLISWGIQVVPKMIERITCVTQYEVAGTFDQMILITADSVLGRQWKLTSDIHAIADKKTGRDLSFNWTEISIQLALYAKGNNSVGVWNAAKKEWEQGPKVSEDFGIVIHMPVGEADCTLYAVDLRQGAAAAELSARVRDWRKTKDLAVSLDEYTPPVPPQPSPLEQEVDNPGTIDLPWESKFAGVMTRPEASTLYQLAKSDVSMTSDRLKSLVEIGKKALKK